ncbi:MAG: DUF2721 domain-containing protein [Kiritimatiellia bacterium]
MQVNISELIPVLQMSVSPVVVISGVGLLLLTLTNRLGRVIDRSRQLVHELTAASDVEAAFLREEIAIIVRRAGYIQRSVFFALLCVLMAALLVVTLFITALLRLQTAWLISSLFVGSMVFLSISLIEFILDINQSLQALFIELRHRGALER